MQSAIREELMALRQLAQEFNGRLERLIRLVETGELQESPEPKLPLGERFRQKYPGHPLPKIAKYAGSLPQNSPENDWKVIRNIAVERYRQRNESSD